MAGGLLNLVANGNKNVILNGNPSKTFFKTTYAKYRNFGLQKFRIDFDGQKTLRETTESKYEFVVPRYADLFMDTYFVITMPNIWSPIYVPSIVPQANPSVLLNPDCSMDFPPSPAPSECDEINNKYGFFCQPYEFKWIENLGAQMIKSVKYTVAGQIIQEFTGQYLYNMVQRDFSKVKKNLFDEMTGNVPELNDPANYSNNNGNYPNYFAGSSLNNEPSIRGRKLYVPLNIWSTLSSKLAFPLIALKHNQLRIEITCRPIRELFVIRDINSYLTQRWDVSAGVADAGIVPNLDVSYEVPPYISTVNKVDPKYQLYLFLTQRQEIMSTYFSSGVKLDSTKQSNWYADPHLISTYAFLDKDEIKTFTNGPQSYLVKEIYETNVEKSANNNEKIKFSTSGLVSSWMWFFQRNDVHLRNEWSNYSNWEYNHMPYPCISLLDVSSIYDASNNLLKSPYTPCPPSCPPCYNQNPYMYPYAPQNLYDISYNIPCVTGPYRLGNKKNIMKTWSVTCDGKLRENTLEGGILSLVDKYIRTAGNSDMGLYCYNFCLSTDPFRYQPTGAMNLSKYHKIEFEFDTFNPDKNMKSAQYVVCDLCVLENSSIETDIDGTREPMVGLNRRNWEVNNYNYNLHIMEERYNILKIENGDVNMKFLRN